MLREEPLRQGDDSRVYAHEAARIVLPGQSPHNELIIIAPRACKNIDPLDAARVD